MIVPLDQLQPDKHGRIICYPHFSADEFEKRLESLRQLQITTLEFTGSTEINSLHILGKGYASIVLIAHRKNRRLALKVRRCDSRRHDLTQEAIVLKKVNSLGIGPELIDVKDDFILMELIEGLQLPEWLSEMKEDQESRTKHVLKRIIVDCWKLDQAEIDHGELSRASKHIIVKKDEEPVIIDFESASMTRRNANVTSIIQYLFFGSHVAKILKDVLLEVDKDNILEKIRLYKKKSTQENLENLLGACLL
jgi:putative serine/threonine protein kinase